LGGVGFGSFGDGLTTVNPPNNSLAGWIAVNFTNDTTTTYNQFTAGYNGEQWRDGGDNEPPVPQTMEFEYGFGSTFGSVPSWTKPGGNFNFVSPVFSTTSGPVDGNNEGLDPGLGGTITDLTWVPGVTLWLRWIEWNDNAFDHGLAIDDFSFSATAVPEPGAALFGGVACGAAAIAILIRRVFARARKTHGT
jgi:hypothetical protein